MLLLDICYKAVVLKTSCIKSTKKLSKKYGCRGPHPDGPQQTLPAAMGIWRPIVFGLWAGPPTPSPSAPSRMACLLSAQTVPRGKTDDWGKEFNSHCLGTLSNFTTLPFSLCQEEVTEGNKAGPRVPAEKETHTSYPLACSLADSELSEEKDCLPPSPSDSPSLDSTEN